MASFVGFSQVVVRTPTLIWQRFLPESFNVATANRDDHLRNHGFTRTPAGWRLAPAYDMNPTFKKDEHVLTLDLHTRQPNMAVVLETAQYYRLETDQAKNIINLIGKVIGGWKARARKLGLSAFEISAAGHLFQPL